MNFGGTQFNPQHALRNIGGNKRISIILYIFHLLIACAGTLDDLM